jgi:hypothetical protein
MLLAYLLAFCRVVFGLLFFASFVGKIRNIPLFERTITDFQLLPPVLSKIAAFAVLGGELVVVGLMLIGGPLLGVGFTLAIILLLAFCLVLALGLVRRMQVSCNCFGASDKQISGYDLGRNVGFLSCALLGLGTLVWLDTGQTQMGALEWGIVGLTAIIFVTVLLQISEIGPLLRQ